MFPRLLALKIFASILLIGCSARPDAPSPADLPNDCAIIATEAFSRLKPTGCWVRLMSLHGIHIKSLKDITAFHHMLIVWQADPACNLFVYDRNGTAELPTKGHTIKDIIGAFKKLDASLVITEARFLSP